MYDPHPEYSRSRAQTSPIAITDVPRAVLEGFAVESYRTGTLSRAEIGDLLGHTSRWDTQAFLAEHQTWSAPTLEEVTSDIASLRNTPVA